MPELITDDTVRLAFDDTGEGHAHLFVHGWAMSGRVWRYQWERFAATHRVITLDLRGHGASSIPTTGPTMDDFAADIVALLTRLDLNRVTLVAWSRGLGDAQGLPRHPGPCRRSGPRRRHPPVHRRGRFCTRALTGRGPGHGAPPQTAVRQDHGRVLSGDVCGG